MILPGSSDDRREVGGGEIVLDAGRHAFQHPDRALGAQQVADVARIELDQRVAVDPHRVRAVARANRREAASGERGDDEVDGAGEDGEIVGLDRGEHARCGAGCDRACGTTPCRRCRWRAAPPRSRWRRRRRRSRWSRSRGCAPTAWPRTASRTRSPRPSRRRSRPSGRSATPRPLEAAVGRASTRWCRRAGTASRARACCRSGRGASSRARSARSSDGGHPPVGRAEPFDALDRRGRAAARARAHRRRRSTSAARSSRRRTAWGRRAGRRRRRCASTTMRPSAPVGPADVGHHAGGRLVVRVARRASTVGVGGELGMRARAPTRSRSGRRGTARPR